jgi:hypothetical protein
LKLLDAENATGGRLEKLFKAQYEEEAPDFARYADFVERTAVPFYEGFVGKAKELAPSHPGLAGVQTELVKYAQSRSDFARVLAANLDALRHPDTTLRLREREAAAEATKQDYAELLVGPGATEDSRFTELNGLAKDFQSQCLQPLAAGKTTHKDFEERVRTVILPRIAKLRAGRFDDDEASRRLRDAVAAAEAFYVAIIDDLKQMEARARLSRAAEDASRSAADAFKKFKDELAAVRRLL